MKSIILFLTLLFLTACATGSALVTGEAKDPISPELVKLYTEPPPEYETIGLVEASCEYGSAEKTALELAIDELKNQAASIGANGIIIEHMGKGIGSFGDVSKEASGKAIYIDQK